MQSFLGVPTIGIDDVAAGSVVVIGATDATPYEPGKISHSHQGPAAIRAASQRYASWHDHFDFDLGAELLSSGPNRVSDLGDITCDPATPERNRENIRSTVSSVLAARAIPMVFGGDDSVPIPVIGAYAEHGPVWIVQIDAHMDWRDERFGEPLGWSSPMRRASEMAWVGGMTQIGIRGVGSAFTSDVGDARTWGSNIVTARETHRDGMAAALRSVPDGADVFVSLDLDAIDPAFMPGVMALSPGGLTYWQIVELFEELASRTTLVGCNIVELAPQRDPSGISALTAARIACNALTAMLRTRS